MSYDPSLVPNVPTASTYTVVAGDTLWGICQRLYGTGLMWLTVGNYNAITDPRTLAPGQILQLPPPMVI